MPHVKNALHFYNANATELGTLVSTVVDRMGLGLFDGKLNGVCCHLFANLTGNFTRLQQTSQNESTTYLRESRMTITNTDATDLSDTP